MTAAKLTMVSLNLINRGMKITKQFIKKIKWDIDPLTGCWNTPSGRDNGEGYKYISYYDPVVKKTKRMGAHRMSYIIFNGKIPKGKNIMHSCDNPACVNPDHLSVGTRIQNTQDMMNKGRNRGIEKGGVRQKLTDEQIISIRNSDLSSYKLAKIYPVTSTHIRRIRNKSRCRDII